MNFNPKVRALPTKQRTLLNESVNGFLEYEALIIGIYKLAPERDGITLATRLISASGAQIMNYSRHPVGVVTQPFRLTTGKVWGRPNY